MPLNYFAWHCCQIRRVAVWMNLSVGWGCYTGLSVGKEHRLANVIALRFFNALLLN
jgi:hypothetical protein